VCCVRPRELVRRYGDLALGVGLALVYLGELAAWQGSEDYFVVAGLAGVGAALALTFRRRSPLASFVVCLALQGVAAHVAPAFFHEAYAVLFMALFNLYSLGANARGTEAWLGLGGLTAAIVLIAQSNGDHTVGGIAFYCAFCGLPWGMGLVIRLRMERVTALQAQHSTLREEAERAVADERARIARELHDVISHAIAVTVLQARGARRVLGHDEVALRRAFGAIEQTNTAALADMRRLLSLLRSSDAGVEVHGQPAPSLERIEDLLDDVRASGVSVHLEVVGRPLPLPPGLDLSAYRIVQEALTNVLKHAGPGARAEVEIAYGTEDLTLNITNTGDGVPRSWPDGGHGLIGIRERIAVLGGSVETGPLPHGYAVHARLPYLAELIGASGGVASS
jgi:signal transduction histidine kinase